MCNVARNVARNVACNVAHNVARNVFAMLLTMLFAMLLTMLWGVVLVGVDKSIRCGIWEMEYLIKDREYGIRYDG